MNKKGGQICPLEMEKGDKLMRKVISSEFVDSEREHLENCKGTKGEQRRISRKEHKEIVKQFKAMGGTSLETQRRAGNMLDRKNISSLAFTILISLIASLITNLLLLWLE